MSIRRKMAKGAAWMVGLRMVDRGIGLVSTIILARLLTPDDFGLVAMAMAVYGLLELLGAFGIDVVLIQHNKPLRVHYDTAWTLSILIMGAQALLLYLFAPAAAGFYGNPEVEQILSWLALGFLFDGLRNIGVVNFRRNLDFNREFAYLFTRRIIGFAVTVYLAYELRSHWALVIGILATRFTGFILSYLMEPFRPRFSLGALHEIYHFSKHLMANNFLHFLLDRAPDFVLGRVAGAGAVGIYRMAYDIAALPVTELSAPVNRALMPGLSRLQSDRRLMGENLLEVFGIMALISLPAGIGLAMIAEPLVALLLGEYWLEAVPVIRLVALWAAVAGVTGCIGSLYLAMGMPQILTRLALLRLVLFLPALYFGAKTAGAVGAGYALLLLPTAVVPINLMHVVRLLPVSTTDLVARIWRPVLATTGMAGLLRIWLENGLGLTGLAGLFVLIFAGVLGYTACILALWALAGLPVGAESRLWGLLAEWLGCRWPWRRLYGGKGK